MCGGSKGATTTTQTQTSKPIGAPYARAIMSRAQQVGQLPYTPITQQIAGLTPEQQAAMGTVGTAYGQVAPGYAQAANLFAQGAAPITADQINQYYNPMAANVMAQMQNVFGQQQRNVTGQLTAAAGGVGADRIAVGQSELGGQQALAAGQTLAGLYQNALQAAQAQQQTELAAGQGMEGLSNAQLMAIMQPAQLQWAMGSGAQQTKQTALNAAYAQQMQQQAFPYQQTAWQAGITYPGISALGATTTGTGTVTPPPPNPFSQVAGLGLLGLGMFAEEGGRIKGYQMGGAPYGAGSTPYGNAGGYIPQEAIAPVPMEMGMMGTMNPMQQAMIAQQYGSGQFGGMGGKGSNLSQYAKAGQGLGNLSTDIAPYFSGSWNTQVLPAKKGGKVKVMNSGYSSDGAAMLKPWKGYQEGGTPGMSDEGEFVRAMGPPPPPTPNTGLPYGWTSQELKALSPSDREIVIGGWSPATRALAGYQEGGVIPVGDVVPFPTDVARARPGQSPYDVSPYTTQTIDLTDLFGSGLSLDQLKYQMALEKQREDKGYQEGGAPGVSYLDAPSGAIPFDPNNPGVDVPVGVSPFTQPSPVGGDPFAQPSRLAPPDDSGVVAPMVGYGKYGRTASGDLVPGPHTTIENPAPGDYTTPQETGQTFETAETGGLPPSTGVAPTDTVSPYQAIDRRLSSQLSEIPPLQQPTLFGRPVSNTQLGLMAAGLGMLGGRSPYFGVNVGQGGLEGINTLRQFQQMDIERQARMMQLALEEQKLNRPIPVSYMSTLRDPVTGQPVGGTEQGVSNLMPNQDTIEMLARRGLAGDTHALQGFGWGAFGQMTRTAVQNRMAEIGKEEGIAPEEVTSRIAEMGALTAGMRTAGTRSAYIDMAANEASQVIPLAKTASDAVDRTKYPTLNSLYEAALKGTGDENIVRLVDSTNAVTYAYARAMNPTGSLHVNDQQNAQKILAEAWSKGQYAAALDQMQKEIAAAKNAPPNTVKEMRDSFLKRVGVEPTKAEQQSGAISQISAPATAEAPPAKYPDAKKAPDGNWYVQRGNQYFKVAQ